MDVFGCSSVRGVCNTDIGRGSKALRCASAREWIRRQSTRPGVPDAVRATRIEELGCGEGVAA